MDLTNLSDFQLSLEASKAKEAGDDVHLEAITSEVERRTSLSYNSSRSKAIGAFMICIGFVALYFAVDQLWFLSSLLLGLVVGFMKQGPGFTFFTLFHVVWLIILGLATYGFMSIGFARVQGRSDSQKVCGAQPPPIPAELNRDK